MKYKGEKYDNKVQIKLPKNNEIKNCYSLSEYKKEQVQIKLPKDNTTTSITRIEVTRKDKKSDPLETIMI